MKEQKEVKGFEKSFLQLWFESFLYHIREVKAPVIPSIRDSHERAKALQKKNKRKEKG